MDLLKSRDIWDIMFSVLLLNTFLFRTLTGTSAAGNTLHFNQIEALKANAQPGPQLDWAPKFATDFIGPKINCHAYPVVDNLGYFEKHMS